MTKEMVKLRKTSDKAKLLEEDKKKLELVVSSLKSSYEKEINVLVAAFQETYFAREKLKKSKIFS